ncbi:MAG: hypothetical protein GY696_40685 [Gammaproteobacteria bacterium]|nr:hypothetical protein [Gammaproteobacteria bacterium]
MARARVNIWNYFSQPDSRNLEAYPDHVVCQGEETREVDKLTENARVLIELRVMILNEKFLASHNRMESKSEHMQLPCNVHEVGCQTRCHTYVWEDSNS